MLDVMRKHTRSWLIKIVFAVIIIVFIFFFGYAQMQKGREGEGGIAARVNGEAVAYARYRIALDEAQEFYKKIFADKIPEDFGPQIRSSALYRVIGQTLFAQLGKKLGITVTPEELYDTIASNPNFQQDGDFDPLTYKNNFLPYFERRFGMNYEALLRQDILAGKVAAFLTDSVTISKDEARTEFMQDNTSWVFDVVKVVEPEPTEGVEPAAEGTLKAEEIAKEVLAEMNSGTKGRLEGLLKRHNLKKDRLEDVTMENRHRLIPDDQGVEVFSKIFALTKDKPTISEPIRSGSTLYLLRLADLSRPSEKEWEEKKDDFIAQLTERKKQDYLREWQEDLQSKAKIEEYVLAK